MDVKVKIAIIGAVATIVAAIIGFVGVSRPTEISIRATQTAEAKLLTKESNSESVVAVTLTPELAEENEKLQTPTQVEVIESFGGEIYDDFETECIDKEKWGLFVENKTSLIFLPLPEAQCWQITDAFSGRNNQLEFQISEQLNGQSYILANVFEANTVEYFDARISAHKTSGSWAGVGLFTRFTNENQPWVYYYIEIDETGAARVVYSGADGTKVYSEAILHDLDEVLLGIAFDGQKMHFYHDEKEVLSPVEFSGLAGTIGLYWAAGENSNIETAIDFIRVKEAK